jgi:hypothetical protein
MMRLRACPRCRGDLQLEQDVYGGPPTLVCLQCGNVIAPATPATVAAHVLQPEGTHRTSNPRYDQ